MAVTKIHPIKSTLKKAIDYICDPCKTEDGLFVSSFACAPETADIEFEFTRNRSNYKASTVLARHMIQSFEPGEITPEKAHEIGVQWADKVLGGKYEYVLATHIDKGHIHNHVIFNNVDMLDHKCYRSNRNTYHQLRKYSDQICEENGLSIIENPVAKNIGRKEYEERKRGTSTKGNLQKSIDIAITKATSYQKFLSNMEAMGYEVKEGKYIAFREKGKERFARAKTLGDNYTEEALRKRIAEHQKSRKNRIYQPSILKINLISNIRAHTLARSHKISNSQKVRLLRETVNTINFLTIEKISATSQLNGAITKLDKDFEAITVSMKEVEGQLHSISETISDLTKYQRLKPIADQYKQTIQKQRFHEKYERELMVFEAAERALDARGINKNTNVIQLKQTYQQMVHHKANLYDDYRKLEYKRKNFNNAQENLKDIFKRPEKSQEREQMR